MIINYHYKGIWKQGSYRAYNNIKSMSKDRNNNLKLVFNFYFWDHLIDLVAYVHILCTIQKTCQNDPNV